MSSDYDIKLRDRREPGHLWADNEIYDVFGDELGANGIGVYMTLARKCYGPSVQISLRDLAEHARMSKDTVARGLAVLIRVGLVLELPTAKARTVKSYQLADAKALARKYVRESVSHRDSSGKAAKPAPPSAARETACAEGSEGDGEICLPVRQTEDAPEVGEDLSQIPLNLSQKTPNLSQNRGPFNKTQDTRPNTPPNPPDGGSAASMRPLVAGDLTAEERDELELVNRVRANDRQRPVTIASWCAEIRQRREAALVKAAAESAVDVTQKPLTLAEATACVAHHCGIVAPRMLPVLEDALKLEMRRSGCAAEAAAQLAIDRYTKFQRMAPLLRFQWGGRSLPMATGCIRRSGR
jgi:uncharacterized protein with PIN domain